MNLPVASPKENMNTASSIRPTPARRAERSSVWGEILASRDIVGTGPSCCSLAPGKSAKRVFAPDLSAIRGWRCAPFKDVDARDKPGHDGGDRLPQPAGR